MNKITKFFNIITCTTMLTTFGVIHVTNAEDVVSADTTYFYVGAEAGYVDPVKSKFVHKTSKTEMKLKKSTMYSGKIGYSYYPQMSLEASFTYHPKYNLSYTLPATAYTPKIPGKTKVVSKVYMLNLIYDLEKVGPITPFVILGAGVTQVVVKPTSSKMKTPFGTDLDIFKVNKTKTNAVSWQMGLGASYEVSPSLTLDLAAKLQVAHNVKINYEVINMQTYKLEKQRPIKQTIGVGEFGLGITYKLPI